VWMIHLWMVENHYPDRVMRQFGLFQQVPSPTSINYQHVLTYIRTSTRREAVKGKISIGRNITGGHKTSPSCLSRSRNRTTMPNTTRTWGGTIREG
jgi:hypothetical protein